MAVTSSRGGVVFTLVALVLVAYLLASERVVQNSAADAAAQAAIARTRVGVLDAYLVSFEEHASASLGAAGYLALSNLSGSVRENGTYVDRINSTLARCILQNRIAVGGAELPCLPDAALLNVSLDRLAGIGEQELGVGTRYALHNVTVTEERPFEVVFALEVSYNITDLFGSFTVVRRNITARVDVTGLEDPVYARMLREGDISTSRAFRQTDLLRFEINATTFPLIYDNSTYVTYEGESPSVLDRYQGLLDSESPCCGIESVVRRDTLVTPTGSFVNYSLVDHHLARHLAGSLPAYRCTDGEVRSMPAPSGGGTIVVETVRFDNLYNLSGSQAADCTWS